MIPTPRTDAAKFLILSDLQSGTREVVSAEFAEILERELITIDRCLVNALEQLELRNGR